MQKQPWTILKHVTWLRVYVDLVYVNKTLQTLKWSFLYIWTCPEIFFLLVVFLLLYFKMWSNSQLIGCTKRDSGLDSATGHSLLTLFLVHKGGGCHFTWSFPTPGMPSWVKGRNLADVSQTAHQQHLSDLDRRPAVRSLWNQSWWWVMTVQPVWWGTRSLPAQQQCSVFIDLIGFDSCLPASQALSWVLSLLWRICEPRSLLMNSCSA